jgi:ferredoxin
MVRSLDGRNSTEQHDFSRHGKIGAPMPKVTVQIDPSVCILAANCVGIEPKLFQIGQESYVELIDDSGTSHGTEYTFDASAAELDMIEEAVESCPTRAIAMQTAS